MQTRREKKKIKFLSSMEYLFNIFWAEFKCREKKLGRDFDLKKIGFTHILLNILDLQRPADQIEKF